MIQPCKLQTTGLAYEVSGEVLKVWDTKAGRTGILVVVDDLSAKNPTMDTCNVKGKGRTKTCDKLVASWKDKA